MSEFIHRPVLLDECIRALDIRPDGIYLDGTLGRAGHSREIAGRLTTGRLICVDRDQAALDAAGAQLSQARAEAERILARARADAQAERERITGEAQKEIPELVAQAVEKLVLENTSAVYNQFLAAVGEENGDA